MGKKWACILIDDEKDVGFLEFLYKGEVLYLPVGFFTKHCRWS